MTKARGNARAGKISEPNSSLDGRPESIETSHPTDGSSDGLREGGSSWLYFEGLPGVSKLSSTRANVADLLIELN
jgi:hypothetical protein